MKIYRRIVAVFAVVLLISAPVSIAATFFLLPLWRWIEATYGIESIGHSGPAQWCYIATFTLIIVGALLIVWMLKIRRKQGPTD